VKVSDDTRPGVAVAPMGWWSESYENGLSSQATTAQRVTALGGHPAYNDNRVEIEPA
jgi:anaerobic selenocysteine-containing dehydrogenase